MVKNEQDLKKKKITGKNYAKENVAARIEASEIQELIKIFISTSST